MAILVASGWLICWNRMMMHGLANVKINGHI